MDSPGYIVLSRLSSQLRATQVMANNLANADTPGFQAERAVFSRYLQPAAMQPDTPSEEGINYSIDRATWRDTQPGRLQTTGNPFDLALQGEGFFVLDTPAGERFTRAGRFTLSPDGGLVDPEGHAVLDERGTPVTISQADTRIEIRGDGSIRSENGVLGKLRVVRFENQQALRPEGDRLFTTDETPIPIPRPNVIQGAVEGSNVQSVLEMVRMTNTIRQFQTAVTFAESEGNRLKSAVERILRANT